MPEVDVKNSQNEVVGSVWLDDAVFAVCAMPSLLHEVVVMQRASMRHGTAATKTRGLVSGGGKKPWKQKGTGRARAGSNRSPLWRGGGSIFGPMPRQYGYSMPKKKARLALLSAISSKVAEGCFTVLDGFSFDEPKTRLMAALLKRLGLGPKVMVVASDEEYALLTRVSNNLFGICVAKISQLNVYDLLRVNALLVTRDSALQMAKQLSPSGHRISSLPVEDQGDHEEAVA